jgi:HAD superfamily hydrolase (TIGR01509 family)
MAPRGVLFDVGNVIVRWNPRTLYSKIFPDPAECDWFLSQVCTMAWHTEHDRGAPMTETIPALAARFPEHAEAVASWSLRWDEMLSGLIPETVEAIEAMHARGVPMFGLTNMPAEWWPSIAAMSPAFGLLTDVVVSAHEGVVKPDARAFELACERSGLAPADLLFVDDNPPNIEAAHRLGFDVHAFDDPAALRPALESRGLL